MKQIVLAAAAATALAGAAFAQGAAPSFQEGSGQRSGGPANELNSPTGGGPPMVTPGNPVPPYQQGSGQEAGGPANELISPQGAPAVTGTIPLPPERDVAPPAGKGQSSGGPRGEQMRREGIR